MEFPGIITSLHGSNSLSPGTSPIVTSLTTSTSTNLSPGTEPNLRQSNGSGGEDEKKVIKKKRGEACEYCRGKHLRCDSPDGSTPCSQCTRRQIPCVFLDKKDNIKAKPIPHRVPHHKKSRSDPSSYGSPPELGPVQFISSLLQEPYSPGQTNLPLPSELFRETQMNHQINSQNHIQGGAITGLETRMQFVNIEDRHPTLQRQRSFSFDSPVNFQGRLNVSILVGTYFDIFRKYVEPFFRFIRLPDNARMWEFLITLQQPGHKPSIKDKLDQFRLYTILANGARLYPNHSHAEDFIEKARELANEVFDESDPRVASGLLLMSYYYSGSSVMKASYFIVLAHKMCENLGLSDSPLGEKCTLSLASLEKNDEIRRVFFKNLYQKYQNQPERLLHVLFHQLHSELTLHSQNDDHQSMLKIIEVAESIYTSARGSLSTSSGSITTTTITQTMSDSLDNFKSITDMPALFENTSCYEWAVIDSHHNEFTNMVIQTYLAGCKAQVYKRIGLNDYAVIWANNFTTIALNDDFCRVPVAIIKAVENVLLIHTEAKLWDYVIGDITALHALGRIYPIAKSLEKMHISDEIRQKAPDFFASLEKDNNSTWDSYPGGNSIIKQLSEPQSTGSLSYRLSQKHQEQLQQQKTQQQFLNQLQQSQQQQLQLQQTQQRLQLQQSQQQQLQLQQQQLQLQQQQLQLQQPQQQLQQQPQQQLQQQPQQQPQQQQLQLQQPQQQLQLKQPQQQQLPVEQILNQLSQPQQLHLQETQIQQISENHQLQSQEEPKKMLISGSSTDLPIFQISDWIQENTFGDKSPPRFHSPRALSTPTKQDSFESKAGMSSGELPIFFQNVDRYRKESKDTLPVTNITPPSTPSFLSTLSTNSSDNLLEQEQPNQSQLGIKGIARKTSADELRKVTLGQAHRSPVNSLEELDRYLNFESDFPHTPSLPLNDS